MVQQGDKVPESNRLQYKRDKNGSYVFFDGEVAEKTTVYKFKRDMV